MEKLEKLADINIDLLKHYPRKILKENRLLPVKKMDDYVLIMTDQNPPLPVIDELEVLGEVRVKLEIVDDPGFDELVNEYLEAPIETVEGMLDDLVANSLEEFNNIELDTQVENLEELAQEAPIVNLVNAIITTALKRGASDIHIEPFENELKVRYRIDGVLYNHSAPPKRLYPAIVTRIKIMARLDIAERRLPQDGRIRIKVLGRELDIRVSFIPTLYGESIVLRLLDRAEYLLDIDNLGFRNRLIHDYKKIISYPDGIILVTGPTGSGKTTTLYATLETLNSSEKKIITVEDPVEYQLDGINQIQVKPEIDFTFARGLRSILRQDPDIIMIGEIRDVETANIAIQAALTGHLVLATLHTNDAASALIRLLDMGVEDYLLAATIRGVIAQRLVRVLCTECRTEYFIKDGEYEGRDLTLNEGEHIYQANGCSNCNDIGYKGRSGIYEFIPVKQSIQDLILNGCKAVEIRQEADRMGYENLFEDGWHRVKNGVTTLDELIRVTRV
ncbi:MAG: type II secretion system ATPase GspE [Bacillota bacterium]